MFHINSHYNSINIKHDTIIATESLICDLFLYIFVSHFCFIALLCLLLMFVKEGQKIIIL